LVPNFLSVINFNIPILNSVRHFPFVLPLTFISFGDHKQPIVYHFQHIRNRVLVFHCCLFTQRNLILSSIQIFRSSLPTLQLIKHQSLSVLHPEELDSLLNISYYKRCWHCSTVLSVKHL